MTYLGVRFGHPLAFDEVQSAPGWDQGSGPRTWFKITWFQQIKNLPRWTWDWLQHGDTATFEKVQYAVTVILQGLFVLGFLFLAWQVWKNFGWGYGLYCFSMLGIALIGTKDFQGTGRYLLSTFPCFLVVGGFLADRRGLRWAWWSVSGIVHVGVGLRIRARLLRSLRPWRISTASQSSTQCGMKRRPLSAPLRPHLKPATHSSRPVRSLGMTSSSSMTHPPMPRGRSPIRWLRPMSESRWFTTKPIANLVER